MEAAFRVALMLWPRYLKDKNLDPTHYVAYNLNAITNSKRRTVR